MCRAASSPLRRLPSASLLAAPAASCLHTHCCLCTYKCTYTTCCLLMYKQCLPTQPLLLYLCTLVLQIVTFINYCNVIMPFLAYTTVSFPCSKICVTLFLNWPLSCWIQHTLGVDIPIKLISELTINFMGPRSDHSLPKTATQWRPCWKLMSQPCWKLTLADWDTQPNLDAYMLGNMQNMQNMQNTQSMQGIQNTQNMRSMQNMQITHIQNMRNIRNI